MNVIPAEQLKALVIEPDAFEDGRDSLKKMLEE